LVTVKSLRLQKVIISDSKSNDSRADIRKSC
jgi:hypothetical protein